MVVAALTRLKVNPQLVLSGSCMIEYVRYVGLFMARDREGRGRGAAEEKRGETGSHVKSQEENMRMSSKRLEERKEG